MISNISPHISGIPTMSTKVSFLDLVLNLDFMRERPPTWLGILQVDYLPVPGLIRRYKNF